MTEKALAEKYGLHPATVCRCVTRMRDMGRYQKKIYGSGKGTLVDEDALLDYWDKRKSLNELEGKRCLKT